MKDIQDSNIDIANTIVSEEVANPVYITATFQGLNFKEFRDNYVIPKIILSKSAKKNCIQGKFFALFVIDTLGKVEQLEVICSSGKKCDEEIIEIINSSSGKWTPTNKNGKKINETVITPIYFPLPDSLYNKGKNSKTQK